MAKVIGRDTSSEAASRESQRRAMDPDVADYEMDQDQPGSPRSPITTEYEFHYPNPNSSPSDSEMEHYDLQIQAVFKRSRPGESSGAGNVYGMPSTTLKRGPMTWIIPTKDLECRCPKIRVNRWGLLEEKQTLRSLEVLYIDDTYPILRTRYESHGNFITIKIYTFEYFKNYGNIIPLETFSS